MTCADSRTLGVYAYMTISLEDVFRGKKSPSTFLEHDQYTLLYFI